MGEVKKLLESFEETKECLFAVKNEINEIVEFMKYTEKHNVEEEIEAADMEIMLNGVNKSIEKVITTLMKGWNRRN